MRIRMVMDVTSTNGERMFTIGREYEAREIPGTDSMVALSDRGTDDGVFASEYVLAETPPDDTHDEECHHGLSLWLCVDPINHYPPDNYYY